MNRQQAIKSFGEYLRSHFIRHVVGTDDNSPRFTMVYPSPDSPGGCVEGCIWFYEDDAEVRCYYSQAGADKCRESANQQDLLELLNFINARVFLSCGSPEGLYEPHMLYTPRIYRTADGLFDISATTIINYDFWQLAPVETADYITIFCPELLGKLANPIFDLLAGNKSLDEAISYIKQNILHE